MPKLPAAIEIIERAAIVGHAVDVFHDELILKLALAKLNLWAYVKRGGELGVFVKEREFRSSESGTHAIDVDAQRVIATLPGYRMLDPGLTRMTSPLRTALTRLASFNVHEEWRASVWAVTCAPRS